MLEGVEKISTCLSPLCEHAVAMLEEEKLIIQLSLLKWK